MHGLLENASAACIEPLHRYAFANTIAGMDDTGDGRGIDGARVRDLRKARGWTQIDLAKASGVSQSALSRIERGDSEGSYTKTSRALAKALGCSEAYLAGESSEPAGELRMVPADDAAPVLGAHPDAEALAAEVVEENPALEPFVRMVLNSGSMRSLNIPLTSAALTELAKVVQRHAERRRR